MPKFFGSTQSIIDWDPIVKKCMECTTGDKNTVTSVVDRSEAESDGPLLQRVAPRQKLFWGKKGLHSTSGRNCTSLRL